jgi:anti-sigma factor RsiW
MESRILAYMDGRLSESERAEVGKHLDACAVCRVRATEFSSVMICWMSFR